MSVGPDTSLGTTWPSREVFRELASDRRVIPVVRRLLADSETPLGIYRKLAEDRPGTFLLESADNGGQWSRYSIIGARSAAILTAHEGQTQWIGSPPAGVPTSGPISDTIQETLRALHTPALPGLPPLTGGLVGSLSYDLVRQWYDLGDDTPNDLDLPDVCLALATDLAVFDHLDSTVVLIANAINHDNTDARVDQAREDAVERLERMTKQLAVSAASTVSTVDSAVSEAATKISRTMSSEKYEESVRAGQERIRAGAASQVVLSQRFDVECIASSLDVYRALRAANPSPYMYLLRGSDIKENHFDVVGSSPEVLVKINDGRVVSRPIGGTRPRGKKLQDDLYLEEELRGDVKELGEHDILVDVAKNDLSQVCLPDSVEVTEYLTIERYSHVMHLVSTVAGKQQAEVTAYDVLRATFPAGTLSGAPKQRALEIIDEIEPTRRGIYGGTIGYFDFAGNLDMAIAIRTGVLRNGIAHIQAGAGIVADSVPEMEERECSMKAAAVVRAVSTGAALKSPKIGEE